MGRPKRIECPNCDAIMDEMDSDYFYNCPSCGNKIGLNAVISLGLKEV